MLKNIMQNIKAESLNIEEVVEIDPKKLKIDARVRWKCKFGCNYYGKRYSCPPNVPESYEEFIKCYSKAFAIIYSFEDYMESKKEMQKIVVEIESKLLHRYPFAFALFPGGCDICEDCEFERTGICKMQEKVRPSIASLGIDVSSLGIKIGDKKAVAIILVY